MNSRPIQYWAATLFLPTLLLTVGTLASADTAGIEFFEKQIRPVLVERCYECHSEGGKAKGDLKLDSSDSLRKGGVSGPTIVPGRPDQSLLIKAIRQSGELKMPAKGQPLSTQQIAAFEEWIRMGAPDPREKGVQAGPPLSDPEKVRNHWAFLPVKNPPLPNLSDAKKELTPIDAFIRAKLDAHKLTPSVSDNKRALIRRAAFDLTGLPPAVADIDAFLADNAPDSFAKVIDRYLASPRYGERWARHWLDVARYADNKGYIGVNVERRYPYSYTYRDYVIRAFNEDLPYNRFILEQVAADQLALGDDKRPLAAMGFLTLGRRFIGNVHDIIDDRIDVVTRGFMGLTVTCARCHDHKYDPIPTADYYSLYGVFSNSMEPADLPLISTPKDSATYTAFDLELKSRELALTQHRQRITAVIILDNQKPDTLVKYLLTGQSLIKSGDATVRQSAHNRQLRHYFLSRWRNYLSETKKSPHPIFHPWHSFAALPEAQFADNAAAVIESFSKMEPGRQLNALVIKAVSDPAPRSLKEVADRYAALFAQFTQKNILADPAEESLRQALHAIGAPWEFPEKDFENALNRAEKDDFGKSQKKVEEWKITSPAAPPRAHVLNDLPKPISAAVFVRGNPNNHGAIVPRHFPEVVAGRDRKTFANGSGRLEMAESIASAQNPLTARVIVNRVWMHHFGQGLVRTPSDFGLRAEPPSHPELLDHLAWRFMAEGWSIKKLHRWIMLSATYQQASTDRPETLLKDPNNLLLSKFNRQRLSFESLRDSLLYTAGRLDISMEGQPVDIAGANPSPRRTIYGFIDRQNLPGYFRTFDFANPDAHSPQRFATTVPQQALYFMNSSFVLEQSKAIVDRPEFNSLADPTAKVRWLYLQVYQRAPSQEEIADAVGFVTAATSNPVAVWRELAQTLLQANEFYFID